MNFLKSISKKIWIQIAIATASASVLVVATTVIVGSVYTNNDMMPILKEAYDALEIPDQTTQNLDFETKILIDEHEIFITYTTSHPDILSSNGTIVSLPSMQDAYQDVIVVVTLSLDDDVLKQEKIVRVYGEAKSVTIELYGLNGLITTLTKKEGDSLLLSELVSPSVDLHTFDGYYFDPFYENAVDEDMIVTDNMILYAKYIPYQTLTIYGFDEILYENKFSINTEIDLSTLELDTISGHTFSHFKTQDNTTIEESLMILTSDQILIAVYYKNTYTITFDSDGGSAVSEITQDYATNITAPEDPTREGYTFNGWSASVPATMPAENLTLKATWTINTYTITFDSDGGSDVSAITQDYATNITVPEDPTREGYTFNGWDQDVPATMPAENLTLKATWIANSYNAVFMHVDGNTDQVIETQIHDVGSQFLLPKVNIDNHFFIGWSLNGELIEGDTYVMPVNDITFHAELIALEDILQTLNFQTEIRSDLVFSTSVLFEGISFDLDYQSNNLETISSDGLIINRPNMLDGDQDVSFNIEIVYEDQLITYVYHLTILALTEEVTVTFIYLNGDTTSVVYELGETLELQDAIPYNDYAFDGYYLDPSFTVSVGDDIIINRNLNIYSKYTLLRDLNLVGYNGQSRIIKVRDGEEISFDDLNITVPNGYTYESIISIENEIIEFPFTMNENQIFIINYDVIEFEATLVLDTDLFPEWIDHDPIVFSIEEPLEDLFISNEKYVLDAIYIDEAKTISFDFESTYLEDLTLYLDFRQVSASILVTFAWDDYIEIREFLTSVGDPIPDIESIQREGYSFLGWQIEDDIAVYDNLSSIVVESDIQIFPVYALNTYTVSFVTDGGIEVDSLELDFGSDLTITETSVKEGYTFDGWYLDENFDIPFVSLTMPSQDIILYAKFSINSYTLNMYVDEALIFQQSFEYNSNVDVNVDIPHVEGYVFYDWDQAIPGQMPASDLEIHAILDPIYTFEYTYEVVPDYPEQIISFYDDVTGFTTYIYLENGILYGQGPNTYFSYGVNVSEFNTWDIMDSYTVNISKNLDLEIGETIEKINHHYFTLYALTSLNRIIKWGMDENGIYINAIEIDTIEEEVELFLNNVDGVSILTTSGSFYAYHNDDRYDITDQLNAFGDFKFMTYYNGISFDLDYMTDGFTFGYNNDSIFQILFNSSEENFELVQIPVEFVLGFDVDQGELIHMFTLSADFTDEDVSHIGFVFENFIYNPYYDSEFVDGPEIEITLDLKYGEIITDVIYDPFMVIHDDLLFFSFYTNFNRLLVPTVDEIDNGNDTNSLKYTYFDMTDLYLQNDTILKIVDNYIITENGYLIFPDIYYNVSTSEYLSMTIEERENEIFKGDISSFDYQNIEHMLSVPFNFESIIYADSNWYVLMTNETGGIFVPHNTLDELTVEVYREEFIQQSLREMLNYTPEINDNDIFEGWYLDEEFEIPATLENVTNDTTLYPKITKAFYDVTFIFYDESNFFNNNIDSIDQVIEMGSIPNSIDYSQLMSLNNYVLTGEVYYWSEPGDDLPVQIDYDFTYSLDKDIVIYIDVAPKTVQSSFVYDPNDPAETVTFVYGEYVYDAILDTPNFKELEGIYFDEALTELVDTEHRVTENDTYYLNFVDRIHHIRYVAYESALENIMYEYHDDFISLVQLDSGDVYFRANNGLNENVLSSPFPSVLETVWMYERFVNVTSGISLNVNEMIVSFIPLENTISYYNNTSNEIEMQPLRHFYAFITSENRVFISGSNNVMTLNFKEVPIVNEDVVLDIVFDYQVNERLFIYFDSNIIQEYHFDLIDGDIVLTFSNEYILDASTTEILYSNVRQNHLILITNKEFLIGVKGVTWEFTSYDIAENDQFVGYVIDNDMTLKVYTNSGDEVTYSIQNFEVTFTNNKVINDNETIEHVGYLGVSSSVSDDLDIALVTNTNMLYVPSKNIREDISMFGNFQDIIMFYEFIVYSDGASITSYNTDTQDFSFTDLQFDDNPILKIYYPYYFILSDNTRLSFNSLRQVNLDGFRLLNSREVDFNRGDTVTLENTYAPDNFFGWSTWYASKEDVDIITTIKNYDGLIYAILNE